MDYDACFFLSFFQRLKMLVTPQPNLCLISSRHEPIKNIVKRVNFHAWFFFFTLLLIKTSYNGTRDQNGNCGV